VAKVPATVVIKRNADTANPLFFVETVFKIIAIAGAIQFSATKYSKAIIEIESQKFD